MLACMCMYVLMYVFWSTAQHRGWRLAVLMRNPGRQKTDCLLMMPDQATGRTAVWQRRYHHGFHCGTFFSMFLYSCVCMYVV